MGPWKAIIQQGCLSAVLGSSALAADFAHFTSSEGREIITLSGPIAEGDSNDLSALIEQINNQGVLVSGIRLNSPGGALLEGAKLAITIRNAKIATVVMRGTYCASACFIVFAAGSEKYVSYGARVGVHGASTAGSLGTIDAPDGTVAMAKMVRELGVTPSVIGQMVVTPYSEMVWLAPADLQGMGVQMTGDPNTAAGPLPSSPQASTAAAAMTDKGVADPTVLRRAVAPLVRALTDCVAQTAIRDAGSVSVYKESEAVFGAYLSRHIASCSDELNRLTSTYDRMDGPGRGLLFVKGPYSADLLRAVLKRIRPQLDAKLAALSREAADKAAQDAKERAAAEAERQARVAEAELRTVRAKAAAAQAEADANAAAGRAEAERLAQIDQVKGAERLLSDKAADCMRHQLVDLVKSGESAETLITAGMVLCEADIDAVLDSRVQRSRLQRAAGAIVDENAYRDRLRTEARQRFITMAVQVKAGGVIDVPPAPASTLPSPVSNPPPLPTAGAAVLVPDRLSRPRDAEPFDDPMAKPNASLDVDSRRSDLTDIARVLVHGAPPR